MNAWSFFLLANLSAPYVYKNLCISIFSVNKLFNLNWFFSVILIFDPVCKWLKMKLVRYDIIVFSNYQPQNLQKMPATITASHLFIKD